MSLEDKLNTVAVLLLGGVGSRMGVLTRDRTKPAVTWYGRYRIVDPVLTTMAKSDIKYIRGIAQYEPKSIIGHAGDGGRWGYDGTTFQMSPIFEGSGGVMYSKGDADAVRIRLDMINELKRKTVLIPGGDHIYFHNFHDSILEHQAKGNEFTVFVTLARKEDLNELGVFKIDNDLKIVDFTEKPGKNDNSTHTLEEIVDWGLSDRQLDALGMPNSDRKYVVSVGIYASGSDRLNQELIQYPDDHSFGKDLVERMVKEQKNVFVQFIRGYWRDVGLIDSYFNSHLDFLTPQGKELLKGNIISKGRDDAPAYVGGEMTNSVANVGSIISPGSKVYNSVLGYEVEVGINTVIDKCILNGADADTPGLHYRMIVGNNSILRYLIADKNVRMGNDVHIDGNFTMDEARAAFSSIGLVEYNNKAEANSPASKGHYSLAQYGDKVMVVLGKQNSQVENHLRNLSGSLGSRNLLIPDGFRI